MRDLNCPTHKFPMFHEDNLKAGQNINADVLLRERLPLLDLGKTKQPWQFAIRVILTKLPCKHCIKIRNVYEIIQVWQLKYMTPVRCSLVLLNQSMQHKVAHLPVSKRLTCQNASTPSRRYHQFRAQASGTLGTRKRKKKKTNIMICPQSYQYQSPLTLSCHYCSLHVHLWYWKEVWERVKQTSEYFLC